MRKILVTIIAIFIAFGLTACKIEKKELTDAEKFKEEYESLNGEKVENKDKVYRSVTIREDNAFIYKDASEIVKMIDSKETFVVYFGFPTCPWCRSIIETLDEVSKDLKYTKIYYVNVLDIRDTLELDENNKVVEKKKGNDDYYDLLKKLDNVLDKYTLTNSKGKEIDTKEKRIYAPNVIAVVNGKAKQLETGISKKQTDAYMELTDKMKKETYNIFKCLINCIKEEENICESKTSC